MTFSSSLLISPNMQEDVVSKGIPDSLGAIDVNSLPTRIRGIPASSIPEVCTPPGNGGLG
jgi:hypothetical protein